MEDIKLYYIKDNTTINGVFYEKGTKVPIKGIVRNCNAEVVEDVKLKDNFAKVEPKKDIKKN